MSGSPGECGLIPGAYVPHTRLGSPQRLVNQKVPHAGKRQPMENRLAWPARNPPVARRACLIRWTEVVHIPSSWFRHLTGGQSGHGSLCSHGTNGLFNTYFITPLIGLCQRVIEFFFQCRHA